MPHVPSIIPALAGACAMLLASAPAQADSTDQLVDLINAFRAAPAACEGRPAQAAARLSSSLILARAQIAPGAFLENALAQAGYPSELAQVISIANAADVRSAMAVIQLRYCRALLSPQFSAVGVARSGDAWQIVLAHPLVHATPPDLRAAGDSILKAVNAARATARLCGGQAFGAAPALAWNDALAAAALAHSREMASLKYFSHQGNDGSEVDQRACRAGYAWLRIGENIASGLDTPEQAVEGWLASPGHCANIMNAGFTEMGAAYAINNERARSYFKWTQVFGTPR